MFEVSLPTGAKRANNSHLPTPISRKRSRISLDDLEGSDVADGPSEPIKRATAAVSVSSDGRDGSDVAGLTLDKHRGVRNDAHMSASTRRRNELLRQMEAGTLNLSQKDIDNYHRRARAFDPGVEFREDQTGWYCRCSRCEKWKKMKNPLDTGHFKTHRQNCQPKSGTGGTPTLTSLFKQVAAKGSDPAKTALTKLKAPRYSSKKQGNGSATSSPSSTREQPCIGLTSAYDPRIKTYLERTGHDGGGAPSRKKVASEMFDTDYGMLSEKDKRAVKTTQEKRWAWNNVRSRGAVVSKSCSLFVSATIDPPICGNCLALKSNDTLRKALSRSAPDPKKIKFNNLEYRPTMLGLNFAHYKDLSILFDEVSHCQSRFRLKAQN
jgi:hypothetical protein